LKDEKQSRLGVFYDDVQKVRAETFGDSFMIDTPPFLLHENIRNTANIYKYATNETELGQDVITNPVEGPTPKTESIANKRKLTQRLNNLLKEYLVDEHLETSSMVILTDDLNGFMELFPEGIAKWKFVERPSESDEEIRVSSVADFKGLESDMVIYIHEKDISQNLNYIAYTRAKYYLLELVMQ
jgi:DNA helicase IV